MFARAFASAQERERERVREGESAREREKRRKSGNGCMLTGRFYVASFVCSLSVDFRQCADTERADFSIFFQTKRSFECLNFLVNFVQQSQKAFGQRLAIRRSWISQRFFFSISILLGLFFFYYSIRRCFTLRTKGISRECRRMCT